MRETCRIIRDLHSITSVGQNLWRTMLFLLVLDQAYSVWNRPGPSLMSRQDRPGQHLPWPIYWVVFIEIWLRTNRENWRERLDVNWSKSHICLVLYQPLPATLYQGLLIVGLANDLPFQQKSTQKTYGGWSSSESQQANPRHFLAIQSEGRMRSISFWWHHGRPKYMRMLIYVNSPYQLHINVFVGIYLHARHGAVN